MGVCIQIDPGRAISLKTFSTTHNGDYVKENVEKDISIPISLETKNTQHSVTSAVLIHNIWCLFHMLIVTF